MYNRNKKKLTSGLIVDGDVKRASQKYKNLHDLKVKNIMTKKPLSVDKDMLAVQCLNLMNSKRITGLLVHKNFKKKKTIGVLHIKASLTMRGPGSSIEGTVITSTEL